MVDEAVISDYITTTFEGVETAVNLGYTFFFYRDAHQHGFATIASNGNTYEAVSRLDRPGVYRLNLGVSRATFEALFGSGRADTTAYDYTALDVLMPHPDYAAAHFLCVLSPSQATFDRLRPLLAEAYELAKARYDRQAGR